MITGIRSSYCAVLYLGLFIVAGYVHTCVSYSISDISICTQRPFNNFRQIVRADTTRVYALERLPSKLVRKPIDPTIHRQSQMILLNDVFDTELMLLFTDSIPFI